MQQTEIDAEVVGVSEHEGRTIVLLDKTIFYPQGGGQPYDTGTIISGDKKFIVAETRYLSGEVLHIGTFEGAAFEVEEKVHCAIDADRRLLNTRLHSAGHLVDYALRDLGISWKAAKGYHFPPGPYDEYFGTIEGDKDELMKKLEARCNEIVSTDRQTEVRFMGLEDMKEVCLFVPDAIPGNKPGRVVMYGEKGIACGGTHVAHLGQIGKIIIRKIKQEGSIVRVAYAIE